MKVPVIKDVRAFLSIARINGYTFMSKYCVKNVVYTPIGAIIEIKINMANGIISFGSYVSNITIQLTFDDKINLLKDIRYLIKWTDIDRIGGKS